MQFALLVIETLPGAAPGVAQRLSSLSGLRVDGHDGRSRVRAVWRTPESSEPESLAEALHAWDGAILSVCATPLVA